MKKQKRRSGEERSLILTELERVRLQKRLENLDAWWPVYALKNPTAEKSEVVRRLVAAIKKRPVRGFSKGGPSGVVKPSKGANAKPFLEPADLSGIHGLDAVAGLFGGGISGTLGLASGVVRASEFEWYDVETKDRADTQDLHVVSPLGASNWSGSNGAYFWEGFTRLDSTWDVIDIFSDSPADRVVHMAVLRITPPAPTIDSHGVFRTMLFCHLPNGAELIKQWFLDDEDDASIQIDLCAAFQPGGGSFPDPSAFTFTRVWKYESSSSFQARRVFTVAHSAHVPVGVRPNLYVGVRLTFEGADCRLQTGFTQHAADAYFKFEYPGWGSTNTPGLYYSYEPDLGMSIG